MPLTERQPWERIEAGSGGRPEGIKAYEAFSLYLQLGSTRSLSQVAARLGKSETIISKWSFTWDWVNRVAAWDDEHTRTMTTAALKASEQEAIEWAARRKLQRSEEWDLRTQLIGKARQMLQWPLSQREQEQRDEITGQVTHVTLKPVKWTMRDAVTMLDCASKLGRMAAGMETEKMLLEVVNKDMDKMSDDELAAHVSQLEALMGKLTTNYQM